MNEQLQQALATIIEKAMTGLDATVDFLSAEIPDVIYQLLLWYGVKSAIIGGIGLVILLVVYKHLKNVFTKPEQGKSNTWWEWSKYSETHTSEPEIIFNLFTIFPAGAGMVMASELMTTLQIWISPKIWLIEYASNLVK